MGLNWKISSEDQSSERARICAAKIGKNGMCCNGLRFKSDIHCQKHVNVQTYEGDGTNIVKSGINGDKGSVRCINGTWYLVRAKKLVIKLSKPAEPDFIPLVEEIVEEEEDWGDDDSPLIRRRSKFKKREIVEEEISSGKDLLPKKKYKDDKPKHVTLEERDANVIIEAMVPLFHELNMKLDAQTREIQSQKREVQRLRGKVEYAFNPFDPRTKHSGTIVHAVHQLEVTQRTNNNEQKNDSTNILRKLRRLEDQVGAIQQPAPVQQQASQQAFINALYAATVTPPRSNTPAQRAQPPPPPQKPAFGNKRYFGPK
jgi:hypothetical protein